MDRHAPRGPVRDAEDFEKAASSDSGTLTQPVSRALSLITHSDISHEGHQSQIWPRWGPAHQSPRPKQATLGMMTRSGRSERGRESYTLIKPILLL